MTKKNLPQDLIEIKELNLKAKSKLKKSEIKTSISLINAYLNSNNYEFDELIAIMPDFHPEVISECICANWSIINQNTDTLREFIFSHLKGKNFLKPKLLIVKKLIQTSSDLIPQILFEMDNELTSRSEKFVTKTHAKLMYLELLKDELVPVLDRFDMSKESDDIFSLYQTIMTAVLMNIGEKCALNESNCGQNIIELFSRLEGMQSPFYMQHCKIRDELYDLILASIDYLSDQQKSELRDRQESFPYFLRNPINLGLNKFLPKENELENQIEIECIDIFKDSKNLTENIRTHLVYYEDLKEKYKLTTAKLVKFKEQVRELNSSISNYEMSEKNNKDKLHGLRQELDELIEKNRVLNDSLDDSNLTNQMLQNKHTIELDQLSERISITREEELESFRNKVSSKLNFLYSNMRDIDEMDLDLDLAKTIKLQLHQAFAILEAEGFTFK